MPLDLLALALSVWLGGSGIGNKGVAAAVLPDVTFRPRERAVSNWRTEAAAHLDASLGFTANVLLGRDPAQVSRCVRLNNYWCIKRAGWAGEIASDAEGHVAFASSAEGADVAALLLRRYYVDYGRKTALAIISRWAPASCGAPLAGRVTPRNTRAATAIRSAADHLTTHGLGSTLRARFLARGRRVAGGARRGLRRSIVPDRLIGKSMPAPAIAVGLGERPLSVGDLRLGSLPFAGLGLGAAPTRTAADSGLSCLKDGVRIQNYAAKVAAGVSANATSDLHLFDDEGRPTPNLARVMHNMSAVEIGPLGATVGLIATAVDRAAQIAAQQAARKAAAPAAGAHRPAPERPARAAPQATR